MSTYPVGGFFVTQVTGPVGFAIGLAQALCGRPSAYAHAGIITTADGSTIEGQPGGARPGNLSAYAQRQTKVCDGPIRQFVARSMSPLTDMSDPRAVDLEQAVRADVAAAAVKLTGTPYSPLDYLALALLHLHLPSKWVRHRVERSGHMICSQLVDAAYRRAGVHLWTDQRLPGDVTPADLADWADTWESRPAVRR